MQKTILLTVLLLFFVSCKQKEKPIERIIWEPYNESADLAAQQEHENPRMRYKLINSKVLDKNTIWEAFEDELSDFPEERYAELKPLVLEKDIAGIQASISEGKLSYIDLTLFYIYRIRKYESDNTTSLNSVISLNPNAVDRARQLDKENSGPNSVHSLYGIPILLKDNIGVSGTMTTAGAIALKDNKANDAFITKKLNEKGAVVLGKANLSEWAYYFCSGCPVGYSAMGGQTINPYGRMLFESGGSSSGSGVSVAANFAVAAVGTETSGSILSPSSQNSVVGLKPTIGMLSRSGIVPISSTLDTPGPMTKSVLDNVILLNAMLGKDPGDAETIATPAIDIASITSASLQGKRLGVLKPLMEDPVYSSTMDKLKEAGAQLVEFEPEELALEGFLTLLNIDMKIDLPYYFQDHASQNIKFGSVSDVVAFNNQDLGIRAPYGQQLFEGIVADSTTAVQLETIKESLQDSGRLFFDRPMDQYDLDAVLSINNYHAGFAAVAKYPALTVPMGYKDSGEPISLTFIARQFEEEKLLQLGYAFEQATKARKTPKAYQ